MVGKFVFKTKKLLSLLSIGVLFFVAIEIWLSHKKMDVLNYSNQEHAKKTDVNNLVNDITTGSLLKTLNGGGLNNSPDYIGDDNNNIDEKNRPKNIFNTGKTHSNNNNVYNDYEDTIAQFGDNFRNRTDFKGGGAGENDDGNYGEFEYGSPDGGGKDNYDIIHEQNHISCKINGDYTIHCLREGNEVYVPFSFIKKYFEITGEIILNKKGVEELMWKHSYAKVYEMSQLEGKGGRKRWLSEYKHDGVFMSFEHYRVEIRDRVKCISAKEGVPISKQWGAQGYFYPIQIAQFGLSHYSKMLIEPERNFYPLGSSISDWSFTSSNDEGPGEKANINIVANANTTELDVCFNTSDNLGLKNFYLNIPKNISSSGNIDFLSFEMKFLVNASLTIVLKTKSGDKYMIHYMPSEETLTIKGNDIYYGVGSSSDWHRLTRDLKIDFQKSLPKKIRKKLSSRLFPLILQRIELGGSGCIRNLQLSDQDHLNLFYHSANWMVKNQDSRGGWPIPVSRVLIKDTMSLEPGWYSAMAQGHAMSLLSRAFSQSGNPVYLRAAYQAINPFLVTSENGGVLTYLFGQHPWYEEYPTTPPSFVINGFMYALFGLYDLAKTLESFGITKASFVLRDGLSLESNSRLNELNSNPYKSSDNFLNKHLTDRIEKIPTKVNNVNKKGILNYLIKDTDTQFQTTTESFHNSRSSMITENQSNQEALMVEDNSPNELTKNNLLNPAEFVHQDERNEISIGRLNDNKLENKDGAINTIVRHKRSQPASVDQHATSFLKAYFLPPEIKDVNTAKLLFDEGLKTLKLALPLFDSGSGSFYDLRHFTIPGCAPNRARWDYHSTHISQLLMALSIDEDPVGKDFFQKTINRWMSYMKGRRAPHN